MTNDDQIEEWKRRLEFAVGKLDKSFDFPGPRREIHNIIDEMEEEL